MLLMIVGGMVLDCWSTTGTIKIPDTGSAIMSAVLMDIMTAIDGGVVRDISIDLMPRVLSSNSLYTTPAFTYSLVIVIF